jgi:hypothetical protein
MDKKRNDLTNADVIQPDDIPDFPTYDNDQPQAVSDLLDSADLGTDVYGENHLQLPPRQTRSGRAYSSILKVTEHCCPKLDIARPDAVAHPNTVSTETVLENWGRDIY